MTLADFINDSTVVQPSSYNRVSLDVDSATVVGDDGWPVLLVGTVQLWIGKKGRTASGYLSGSLRHQRRLTVLSVVRGGESISINKTI